MTTWTPKTQQAEVWTANTPGLHVFSPDVFSHAISSGKRVFALGSSPAGTEFWDRATVQSETWTVIP